MPNCSDNNLVMLDCSDNNLAVIVQTRIFNWESVNTGDEGSRKVLRILVLECVTWTSTAYMEIYNSPVSFRDIDFALSEWSALRWYM